MKYFLDTVETIPDGVGFSQFGPIHFLWLGIFIAAVVCCCHFYRKSGSAGRNKWRKTIAALIVGDELFKMAMLTIGGNYLPSYLPLHLCSINIIIIAIHCFKPAKLIDNFLYVVCVPGALAALLFPTWTELPPANFMHLHSFTVHILLALYPLMLTVGGDIKPDIKLLPRLLLMLIGMAIPIYFINLLLDTNFMFLMSADPGNPLYIFEQLWGNHLYGFPVLIAAVLAVMYAPFLIIKLVKKPSKVNA